MNLIITELTITEDYSQTQKPPKLLDLTLKIRVVSNGDFSGFILEDNSLDDAKLCLAILDGTLKVQSLIPA